MYKHTQTHLTHDEKPGTQSHKHQAKRKRKKKAEKETEEFKPDLQYISSLSV